MGAKLSYPTVDLSGKVAVVTGGNAGIGYETAKALAFMGAQTIIACRSKEKATTTIERMKEEVHREHPEKQLTVEYMQLDLASFQSTKDFTIAFKERNLPLHLLINNAGVAWVPYTQTVDGYELQLQANHLGHFMLTLELLPTVLDTASSCGDCRIIFVSSSAHSMVNWEPENMNAEQQYSRLKFYPNSKLYNVMTAYALQRRLQNVGMTVSSLHPGIVNTDIATKGLDDVGIKYLFAAAAPIIGRTPKDGAATTINCAVNPELNTQQALYYDNCRPTQSSSVSRNQEFQEEMWRTSIAMVKDYLSPDVLERYGPRADQSDGAPELTLGDESETTLPITTDVPEQSHEEKQIKDSAASYHKPFLMTKPEQSVEDTLQEEDTPN